MRTVSGLMLIALEARRKSFSELASFRTARPNPEPGKTDLIQASFNVYFGVLPKTYASERRPGPDRRWPRDDVRYITVTDADPAVVSLTWTGETLRPEVEAFIEVARTVASERPKV
jgi:hypothetical protein